MAANITSYTSETAGAAGRAKTSFRPEYIDQAHKLAQLGATDIEIAEFLGVSRAALSRWKLAHPEFGEALAVGKAPADERVVRSLYQRAIGFHYFEQRAFRIRTGPNEERIETVEVERYQPGDVKACILWLRSRRRAEWCDRPAHDPAEGRAVIAQIAIDRVIEHLKTLDDAC